MAIYQFVLCILLCATLPAASAHQDEQTCSRLNDDFEKLKTEVDKLTEIVKQTVQDHAAQTKHNLLERDLETEVSALIREVERMKAVQDHAAQSKRYLLERDLETEVSTLISEVEQMKAERGSTYVRWGRTTCNGNATAVYKGYTGGNWHTDTGGPANYVCLPENPTWAKYLDGFQGESNRMYGTEYEDNAERTFNPFGSHRDDEDAPCVVCRSPKSTSIMIPARTNCYAGWHLEYTGYLMTMSRDYPSASEYICVDKDPEVIPHGTANMNGDLLYVVEAACGSLPCLPYVQGRELACAVCSK